MKVGINTRLMREKYQTGIQTYINNLTKHLKNLEGVTIVELSPKKKGRWEQLWFDSWGVRKEIRKQKIEVFHSPSMVLPEGSKLSFYVVTIHDLGYLTMAAIGRPVEKQYFALMMERTRRLADRVIVDSEAMKKELVRYFPDLKKRVRVVRLGVEDYFRAREKQEYLEIIKKKYLFENKKIVLTNSAHSPRKNVETLLSIWGQVRERVPGAKLLVSGTVGEKTLRIVEGVDEIGYVSKRELRALYQTVELFVYPSQYEGFGLPVLEAMASQCLVLASKIPAIEELGLKSESMFDPHSKKEMVEKIVSYLQSGEQYPREKREHQQLANKYNWQEVARETRMIYEESR